VAALPRARLILQALDDHHVTLFRLWQIDDRLGATSPRR